MSKASDASSDHQEAVSQPPKFAADTAGLDLAFRIRQSHHDAIWEEQKHFTWLLSITFSAQAVVLAGTELSTPDKAIIKWIASVVGILIALIGFRAQRIEGVYYHRANTHFAKEFLAVYPDAEEPHHSQAARRQRGIGVRECV